MFGARFTGVVYPGDRLVVEIWLLRPGEIGDRNDCEGYVGNQDELDEVRFRVTVGGRAVLSDGRAVVRGRGRDRKMWEASL
jgi:acyl dehydratase